MILPLACAHLAALFAVAEYMVLRGLPMVAAHGGRAFVRGALLFVLLAAGTAGIWNAMLLVALAGFAIVSIAVDSLLITRPMLSRTVLRHVVLWTALGVVWRAGYPYATHAWCADLLHGAFPGLSAGPWLIPALGVVTAVAFNVDGGTQLVRGILARFPETLARAMEKGSDEIPPPGADETISEWIGVLERWIVLAFVFTGSFTAIAFALMAKSIARFKDLDDRNFAEYYLLGTSGSVLIAVGSGLLVRALFGLP